MSTSLLLHTMKKKSHHLFLAQSVAGGREDCVASGEGLSTRTGARQDLAGRNTLLAGQVGKELLQVTVEALDLAGSDKAENILYTHATWSAHVIQIHKCRTVFREGSIDSSQDLPCFRSCRCTIAKIDRQG